MNLSGVLRTKEKLKVYLLLLISVLGFHWTIFGGGTATE
jgi:hypothetical protein